MNIKMVLFDLDGTLLPMDQDAFTEGYFRLLAQKMEPHGYDAKQLVNAIWAGTAAMVKNDGSRSNEEAFWEKFAELVEQIVASPTALRFRLYGGIEVTEQIGEDER